jgi:hypothetical protein
MIFLKIKEATLKISAKSEQLLAFVVKGLNAHFLENNIFTYFPVCYPVKMYRDMT